MSNVAEKARIVHLPTAGLNGLNVSKIKSV